MFKHVARCPVCKTVLDELITPTEELMGMAEAMCLNHPRHEHGKASPACTQHQNWYKGWVIDDPVFVEEDEDGEES